MMLGETDRERAALSAQLEKGEDRMKVGDYGAAQARARSAMTLAPDDPRPARLLFRAHAANRSFLEACAIGFRCLTLIPGERRMQFGQMRALFSAGVFAEAARLADTILAVERDGSSLATVVLFDIARVFRRVGRDHEANELFARAVARDPGLASKREIVGLTATLDQFDLR